jgi:hypothetical protein
VYFELLIIHPVENSSGKTVTAICVPNGGRLPDKHSNGLAGRHQRIDSCLDRRLLADDHSPRKIETNPIAQPDPAWGRALNPGTQC